MGGQVISNILMMQRESSATEGVFFFVSFFVFVFFCRKALA